MIDLSHWMPKFLQALDGTFHDRVWFVGLQGSYSRQEATETSDLDLVVVLDELSASDIASYNAMLDTLPSRELLCGFLSGKNDLLCWEPSDLFQLYHDTLPIKGSLDPLLPLLDGEAVDRAIKIGACNIYHGCVHNMLYEKSPDVLQGLYKYASFVAQAIAFRQTGSYVRHQKDLLGSLSSDDRPIVEGFLNMKAGKTVDFEAASHTLFAWAKRWIEAVK